MAKSKKTPPPEPESVPSAQHKSAPGLEDIQAKGEEMGHMGHIEGIEGIEDIGGIEEVGGLDEDIEEIEEIEGVRRTADAHGRNVTFVLGDDDLEYAEMEGSVGDDDDSGDSGTGSDDDRAHIEDLLGEALSQFAQLLVTDEQEPLADVLSGIRGAITHQNTLLEVQNKHLDKLNRIVFSCFSNGNSGNAKAKK
jgi:hypothetical protein